MPYKIEFITYNNFLRIAFRDSKRDAEKLCELLKGLKHVTEVKPITKTGAKQMTINGKVFEKIGAFWIFQGVPVGRDSDKVSDVLRACEVIEEKGATP